MSDNLWVNFLGYKVKAMIHPIVSIAAFFVDQLAQAPVQIQCVLPPNADPGWKQWIPTAVSLLSIGIGVWIAQWSFHASSRRDHERWVLDQKKAEWRELLVGLSETFREYMPPYMSDETAQRFIQDVGNIQRRTDGITMPFIFIAQYLEDQKFYSRIEEFKILMLEQGEIMQSTVVYNHFPGQANSALQSEYDPVVRNYDEIIKFIRVMAEKDMALKLGNDKKK
jgi:hypothetical protein